MKKTITLLSLAFSILETKAQTTVADFENLTLGTDTFYENHAGNSWQTPNATFRYTWDTAFGGYWNDGFAYTNKNNITNGTYTNMYAAITGKGYNNSNKYVTAWAGYGAEKMIIKLAPAEKIVNGFFVTNSTYSYKTMLNGGGPARAFGDTLHTHSGMAPGNYPDWFKLTVRGYKSGNKTADTVEFYLADYRFTDNTKDYIINTWKWVDCSSLGAVDSVFFTLYSSDVGAFGINNPTYFCMDNFTTSSAIPTGISKKATDINVSAYPNPFSSSITIYTGSQNSTLKLSDVSGKIVYSEILVDETSVLDLRTLQAGVYFLELVSGDQKTIKKIIKY